MMKAEKIRYYSQLEQFPWGVVAKTACGITTAAMAISLFDSKVEPLDVLRKAVDLHMVPWGTKNYWLTVKDENEELLIPLGQKVPGRLLEVIASEGLRVTEDGKRASKYQPVFSLVNGYDHRGSKLLFGSFGVKAEMWGDKNTPIPFEELGEKIRSGAMFMASVQSVVAPWMDYSGKSSTHILLVTDVVRREGREYFHIFDPYSTDFSKKVIYQPTDKFEGIEFNGYGTVIYTK